ncbi:MAG: PAS domain S-box protein [Alphaproteobacteria bacterium]
MSVVLTIYALSFFALGVSVAARVRLHPVLATRRPLFALAAFGLIHSAFEWVVIAGGYFGQVGPPPAALALLGASFLALMAFGLAWQRRYAGLSLGLCASLIIGWFAVFEASGDLEALEVFTRMAIGVPASLLAAYALYRDAKSDSAARRKARYVAAAALLLYGATQLFSRPGNFFPASALNTQAFATWFGFSCLAVGAAAAIVLTGAIIALLDHLDLQMHAGADANTLQLASRLEEAQRVGNMGSWVWEVPTNSVSWSDQVYRIFGVEPREFGASYEAFLRYVHEDDRALVMEAVRRALEGAPYSIEFRITHRDGTVRSVDAQAEVSFDKDGKPVRMIGTVQDVTERVALERARDAERQLRQDTLDNLLAGVVVYGLDGRLLEANRTATESLGLSRQDLVGLRARDANWWSYSQEAQAAVEKALGRAAAGERVRDDYRIRVVGGQFITADIEFAPLRDSDGSVKAILSSGVDVSARTQIEESLQRSEARLRAILDSEPECVKTVDENGRILDMNRAGLDMVEADSIDQVRGVDVLTLIEPDYHEDYRDGLARALRGERVEQRYEIIGLKGTRRWMEQTSVPLFDTEESGRASALIAVTRDVTERVQAEEALRENREMLSGILSISPEATIIADQDLRILMFSAGAAQIFGYSSEEMVGRYVNDLMPERFHVAHERAVVEFAGGIVGSRTMGERTELVGRRKNGEEFPAEASLSKLLTTRGLVYTAILRDISAQKAAREEIVRAKQQAEAANEAKSRFIANMSHELRTPLNAIIGFSEIIARETFGQLGDARYRDYARDVQESGQHLLSLINEILDISRIEAGHIELREEEPISIRELVDHCIRWVAGRAEGVGVTLTSEIPDRIPALRGDSRLLTQILLNLTSNALKFTPAGGRVCLWASTIEAGGVSICVSDTGIGMKPEEVARIGEPFLQFDAGRAMRTEGTGLGVSIAKRLAELHGGRLEIESAPGMGTRIALCLPPERTVTGKALCAVGV